MKQGQLQMQNTGKNLIKWMLHMSKLRLLREGAGCREYVLLTSAMRFSNFVSKFSIAALTCEHVSIRLQLLMPLTVNGVWFGPAEAQGWFKEIARPITTTNLYADCILKFHVSLSWWNELYERASRGYPLFITRQLPWPRRDFGLQTSRRLRNSDFTLPTSDFQLPALDFRPRTLDTG